MDPELDPRQFVLMMRQIAEEKNLPFEIVQDALEQALAAAYRKDYGHKDQVVRAALNTKTGDFKLYVSKEVVEEVEEPQLQLTLAEAKQEKADAKMGELVETEVKTPQGFGRVAAQTAKQVILQKLREAERDVIFEEFSDQVGTLLNGTVQRVEPRVVYIDLGRAQGILPASEQIPREHYNPGQRLRVFLRDVETSPRGPQLILSRAVPEFVELLFEREVPEMENKAVEIKVSAREAGTRTKVAVASSVPGVDPVGTFVGGHGTRVQAVMNEVGEEKIDIVPFSDDPKTFIGSALSPTKIARVELDEANKQAVVTVPDDQLSVAIGKSGQNVRLASKLTGWQIDIKGESGELQKPEIMAKPANEKRLASKQDLESALLEALESTPEKADKSGPADQSGLPKAPSA
ncbi:transcription termination/antitermination protein NusA [Candidatus Microgenomates bacterium]|nr:transcription termination/antitermination protein NusA [Candidatus Microgenomates bacterium]